MVGIVVVSHSRPLARAAVEFARQMLHGRDVRVAVAAGLDEATPGTDAVRITAAVEEVDGPDGVLVLMDLGSAVLSAELALDLLEAEVRSRVLLCPAPLVEGLVVAMVAAAGGAPLADVAAEASASLAGKQAHLAPAHSAELASAAEVSAPEVSAPKVTAPEVTGVFVVGNEHGLHARPAARLVAEVRALDAWVTLQNLTTGSAPIPAGSLSRVATLGALHGHRVQVTAEGRQAHEALEHVLALAARHFDDAAGGAGPTVVARGRTPDAQPHPSPGPLPAAPGVAVGPVWVPKVGTVETPDEPAGDPAAEWRRLRAAAAAVRRETVRLRARTARELGESEAAIFDAHLMLLDDPELLDQVHRGIDAGHAAAAAWADAIRLLEDEMVGLADSYQRARAADVRGVGDQVLRTLLGVTAAFDSRDGILVAADLTPAEATALDPAQVRGIVLAYGSPTSHSAILVRSLGIPMVVAAGPDVLAVAEGTTVALDGGSGELVVDPDPETLDRYHTRAVVRRRAETEARALAARPARTTDGVTVEVAANVGSLADAEQARSAGADAAGLVRTEFLFLDRVEAPDVDEQEVAYRALAEALDGRRLTLRTLDVGGDKPLSYLPTVHEANPFLGLRGIRLSLSRRELLRDQLIAACRVAADTPVSLMFPMVSTVDELVTAIGALDEAVAATGGARPAGLRVGIMVEVPAAALKAAAFVPYVDFFSIGTNDLTQYTLAAERGNDGVARLADPLDPAVLRLIDGVCRAASGRVDIGVCGEVASEESAIPLLLGMGIRELSVVPAAVPLVKQTVRRVDTAAAAKLSHQALDAPGAREVRALLLS
jgi:phosphoenolpyruvate-protein phosphotransferase/dihydroxyacetone kinase phosphotransfer subunit